MWQRDLFILGARIDPVTFSEAIKYCQEMVERPIWQDKSRHYVVTANPEIVLQTIKDDDYRLILNKSSLTIADGVGLKFGAWVMNEKIPERITGVDLMLSLCAAAAQEGWPIFLLGGRDAAVPAADALKKKFPGLKVAGAEPGPEILLDSGKISLDAESDRRLVAKINASGAKILFVAFGAPKQEKWIVKNLPHLSQVKLAVGVGGSFDYVSGQVARAPAWMRGLGLEWLFRFFRQPWRAKRVFNATFKFVFSVIFCRLRICAVYRPNVVGFILNGKNQVLVVAPSRLKYFAWQFPQGGVDKGETEEQAIRREMKEELGTDKFEIIKKASDFHSYIWPKWAQRAQCYKGQKQTLFIMKFTGTDADFNLKHDIELKAFKWVELDEAVAAVDKVRKPVAEKAIKILKNQ